jgi:hypothetical protein
MRSAHYIDNMFPFDEILAWIRALPRIASAALVQVVAAVVLISVVRAIGRPIPLWGFVISTGALAAAFTNRVGLERWWVSMQLAFPLLLLTMLTLDWSPWVYLSLFAALALVYWSTFRTRVPLYLSNAETWQAIEALLPAMQPGRTVRFVDLGSGLGGLLFHLSKQRSDIQFEGIELAPLPVLTSQLRGWLSSRRNLRFHWGSFWKRDLADFDVVFAFLSPVPMLELWRKAEKEMRAGSLFVSCAFEVPGQMPDRIVELSSTRQPQLLIWRM